MENRMYALMYQFFIEKNLGNNVGAGRWIPIYRYMPCYMYMYCPWFDEL